MSEDFPAEEYQWPTEEDTLQATAEQKLAAEKAASLTILRDDGVIHRVLSFQQGQRTSKLDSGEPIAGFEGQGFDKVTTPGTPADDILRFPNGGYDMAKINEEAAKLGAPVISEGRVKPDSAYVAEVVTSKPGHYRHYVMGAFDHNHGHRPHFGYSWKFLPRIRKPSMPSSRILAPCYLHLAANMA